MFTEDPAIELVNCSTLVIEGTKVDCTCGRNDRSDIATRIVWYQGNTAVQQDNDISVLSSKVASQAQGIGFCFVLFIMFKNVIP